MGGLDKKERRTTSAMTTFSDSSTMAPVTSVALSQECADHLCTKRGCDECGGDRFKPLLDFDEDTLSMETQRQLCDLGWTPEMGNPAYYFDEYGDSLLHSAARRGNTEVLKELLTIGAEVNIRC